MQIHQLAAEKALRSLQAGPSGLSVNKPHDG
jgi:hypothetical protein